MQISINNNSNQLTGSFNECNFSAEKTSSGIIQKFIVMYDQTILALYENGKFIVKPYPNWKHTVNQIFNHIKTVAY